LALKAGRRLRTALKQAEERGFLGSDILGSGFSLEVYIKEGAAERFDKMVSPRREKEGVEKLG
jgi:hypothetical protein